MEAVRENEPVCQVFTSKVGQLRSYCPDIQTSDRLLDLDHKVTIWAHE